MPQNLYTGSMTIDYKAWAKHFKKTPRSTEVVLVPRDVFDFLLATNEAYGALDGGDIPNVVACQGLALDLLREIAQNEGLPDASV